MAEPTRKVVIERSAGEYVLRPAEDCQTNRPGVVVVEILESEWREYLDEEETRRRTQEWIWGLQPRSAP
jgi:hypothetical protein